ncbi:MAG: hypothetical protein HON98_11910 [Chloroflexi bacterium]|jgi:regulatory protein|nr:hypothetical protein [Chloroflexota bacterium]MBT3669319.1 hypothetical protein [Chloroflexota bacterium]MBT4532670.1 hypothetical protein [Chloroflexota bacterium]MBT4684126.1 hypothetical protein [Chloroflexota bacterium]MBT4756377.1 hypothetical protein [Chloroflexota bacterium]
MTPNGGSMAFCLPMTRKITALKVQKRNKNRVNVYLDNEFAFGLSRIVAGWLKTGQELSEEKILEIKSKDEIEISLQRALNFLSYRPRSEEEVRKNLRKHDTDPEIIERIIERLQEGKLVNDVDFANLWVENRSDFRPRGRRALRAELRQKGVNDQTIEETLIDIDEEELAYRAAVKKSRRYKELEWLDFRKKMNGFLARRGFNYSEITIVVEKVWNEIHSNPPK